MATPPDTTSPEYRHLRMTFILWLIAGILAFGAVIIRFVASRTIAYPPLTAGLFMFIMAFSTRKKMKQQTPPGGA